MSDLPPAKTILILNMKVPFPVFLAFKFDILNNAVIFLTGIINCLIGYLKAYPGKIRKYLPDKFRFIV